MERHAWLNVGCGTHNAPAPWWNIDVVEEDEVEGYGAIHPDEVVPRGKLPYKAKTVERVMLSHVLEHVPWENTLTFLADIKRVMKPGGELMAIGPDAEKTIRRWHDGREPWELVTSVLEHAREADLPGSAWPEARHWWNCTEARMVMLLEAAGFRDVTTYRVPSPEVDTWPTAVPWAEWQSAVKAYK